MATTTLSPDLQTTRLASRSANITIIGVLCFAALVATLHFLRPDLNPISDPTSAYAVGPYSFLMTAAFFSMSVASFALVLGLYRRVAPPALSRIGLALLGAWATGVLIAMIFPMDADGAPTSLSGTIHRTAGPLTFLYLTIGMILVSWAFRQDEKWRPFYRAALTLSFVMLAAFAATFLSFATDSGTLGIAQRIALTTAVIWILLTAARLRSTAPGNGAWMAEASPAISKERPASDERSKPVIQIEETHIYPVPLSEGFAYITDVKNWGDYWPDFVRINDPARARWSKPGDSINLVLRLLNRERELGMVLEEFKPEALVTYVSRQPGLPDAHHERHFRAVPKGFEYRLVVNYAPRSGLAGLFDRSLVRRAVTRAVHKTVENLDSVFDRWNPTLSTKGD
jgi:hypothetical protein